MSLEEGVWTGVERGGGAPSEEVFSDVPAVPSTDLNGAEAGAGVEFADAVEEAVERTELGRLPPAAAAKLGFCAQALGGGVGAEVGGVGDKFPERRELGREEGPFVLREEG